MCSLVILILWFFLFRDDPFKSEVTWTAVISGYMKFGKVEMAEKLYGEMPLVKLVAMNCMIAGYVENGLSKEALKFFKRIVACGFMPNPSTLSSVLIGCSNLSSLSLGKQVHQFIYKSPLYLETTVRTSLLRMYCKCGVLDEAWSLFNEMPRKDLVTWNSMISGYAHYCKSDKALFLFNRMTS
ncbi:hypothetical protein Droror1_Dr00018312 [Drosera rotundifolia]